MTDRRAAQIAAVREVMGWAPDPDDPYEGSIADLAAEIVDAVMALHRCHAHRDEDGPGRGRRPGTRPAAPENVGRQQ